MSRTYFSVNYKYKCLGFRLQIAFTKACLLGDVSAWRYAWEWVCWPSCLYVRSSSYVQWPSHLWSWAHGHSGVREQEHRAGGVASLCYLCLLESVFRCVGLASLLGICELGCFCAWMCFTGERVCISQLPTPQLTPGSWHTHRGAFLPPGSALQPHLHPLGQVWPWWSSASSGHTHLSTPSHPCAHPLSVTAAAKALPCADKV